jgi:hypothetical protein
MRHHITIYDNNNNNNNNNNQTWNSQIIYVKNTREYRIDCIN